MFYGLRYGILKGLSAFICSLSYERVLSAGRFLGPFILNRIGKQKKRGLEQIMTGMEVDQKQAEALLQRVYEHIGMSVLEMLYMPKLCREKENINDYVAIDHPEYLEAAYALKRGIVGLTAHMGNWEWLGAGLALHGYDTSAIGKKQKDAALMKIINAYRAEAGQHIFLTGTGGYEMIAAARAMRKNYILGFLSDKDGDQAGVPVAFMNRIFSFPQGPVVFAKKFKAPVVPIFITRNKDKPGHTIRVLPHFFCEDTGDKEKDLLTNSQKMATIMENFIKDHPEDWLWFQHLFWTRPDDIKLFRSMTMEEKDALVSLIHREANNEGVMYE